MTKPSVICVTIHALRTQNPACGSLSRCAGNTAARRSPPGGSPPGPVRDGAPVGTRRRTQLRRFRLDDPRRLDQHPRRPSSRRRVARAADADRWPRTGEPDRRDRTAAGLVASRHANSSTEDAATLPAHSGHAGDVRALHTVSMCMSLWIEGHGTDIMISWAGAAPLSAGRLAAQSPVRRRKRQCPMDGREAGK